MTHADIVTRLGDRVKRLEARRLFCRAVLRHTTEELQRLNRVIQYHSRPGECRNTKWSHAGPVEG